MGDNSDIIFRKGTMGDLNAIFKLFQDAISEMNKNRILQWDEAYPDEEVLKEDIKNKQLYVGETGNKICSVFVLNQEAEEQYAKGAWIDSNLIGVGINLVISIIFIIAALAGVIKNKRREYQ